VTLPPFVPSALPLKDQIAAGLVRTSAVSSIVNPPKYRNSTRRTFCGSNASNLCSASSSANRFTSRFFSRRIHFTQRQ
jgi:hypothetical protein